MAHSMPTEISEDYLLEDDYYAFLNLRKDATSEEIIASYRRLSRLYHPDKHSDPEQKRNAEIMFNKTKTAYEVLSDPHQRAIYDTVGVKGLETGGWSIVERTKTPQEIREEYEHLLKEKEERLLQQRSNPKGTIIVGVNATDLFETYDSDFEFTNVEISSMSISQSVEVPLEINETLTVHGGLGSQNGTGSGTINCDYRKVFSSNSWMQFGLGAGNGFTAHWKGFRAMSKYSYCTLNTTFHVNGNRLSPGLELIMCRQLDKKTTGCITINPVSRSSFVNTSVIRETEKGRLLAAMQIGIKNSFLHFGFTKKMDDEGKLKCGIKIGTLGGVLEYGIERKISSQTTLGGFVLIGIPSGVTMKLKVLRSNQTFAFPILLSEEILPSSIFYGTTAPIVIYYLLKTLYIDPYSRRRKKREADKEKEANTQRMTEKKKEASIAVSLMQETYHRIKSSEEKKNGLIITFAAFGSAETITNLDMEQVDSQLDILDVTVQLQCLVKDSRLILPDRPKSNLPGFYDPCLGEEKVLKVDYLYRNKRHSITIADNEMLRIPRLSDS